MSRTYRALLSIVLVGAFCSVCPGQDARIQYGDVLDASPLAGSGGRNTVSSGQLVRERGYALGYGSQMFVTGRVTGLGAFRGSLPYTPSNQFQVNVPSARLSDFNRRSVGLRDVLRGRVYKTRPYFSRSKTALGAAGILSGRAAVGTNMPRTTSMMPSLTRKLRADAMAKYRSLLPSPAGRVLSVPMHRQVGPLPIDSTRVGLSRTGGATDLGAPPARPSGEEQTPIGGGAVPAWFLTRAGALALFGALQADSAEQLARELYRIGNPREPIDGRIDAFLDGSVDSQYKLGGEQVLPREGLPADANSRLGGAGAAAGKPTTIRRNEDVYVDLLLRLRERRTSGSPAGQAAQTPAAKPAAPVKSIVELDAGRGVVVHGLAGLGKDDVNRYMAVAQDRLRRGRYYDAVERFRLVRIFDRDNPLPLVGMGLAYFGAGEAYSAGLHFREAIEIFPPLMESRIDVAEMMELKDARAQLVNLEQRLRDDPYTRRDPHVYFAACFMSNSVGDRSEAVRYAEIIQKLAPENKIIRAYARFVLTGKPPEGAAPPGGGGGASSRPAAE